MPADIGEPKRQVTAGVRRTSNHDERRRMWDESGMGRRRRTLFATESAHWLLRVRAAGHDGSSLRSPQAGSPRRVAAETLVECLLTAFEDVASVACDLRILKAAVGKEPPPVVFGI